MRQKYLILGVCLVLFVLSAKSQLYTYSDNEYLPDSVVATLPTLADIPPLPDNIVIVESIDSAALQTPVSKYPEFPGGKEAFEKWKTDNIMYPREAHELKAKGKMHLCAHITSEGRVDSLCIFHNENVTDSINRDMCETIAFKLVGRMPNWQHAKDLDGKPADFWYYMVVNVTHPDMKKKIEEEKTWEKEGVLWDPMPLGTAPEFPGGDEMMFKWVSDQIIYPQECIEEEVSGRVIMQFVVDFQGFIKDIQVVRGRHPLLDKEATRIFHLMPRWKPSWSFYTASTCDGSYILPVTFKLKEEKKEEEH